MVCIAVAKLDLVDLFEYAAVDGDSCPLGLRRPQLRVGWVIDYSYEMVCTVDYADGDFLGIFYFGRISFLRVILFAMYMHYLMVKGMNA